MEGPRSWATLTLRPDPPLLRTRPFLGPGRFAIEAPAPHGFVRALALAVATGGGAGYAPVAPGTVGSAVGVALFWPLAALGLPLLVATVAGAIALGVWAADEAERIFGRKDDGRIVIDEVAGQLLTLLPLVPAGRAASAGWLVTGFVAFRVLDVWKPGPVRWLQEHLRGGLGVVMDDVLAGVFGAAGMAAALAAAR